MKYYSQCGQDEYLDKFVFKGKTGGVFLDVGAHDGIWFSNTYFFEQHRGWTGFCVEPNPDVFPLLEKNRKAQCHNCCILDERGTVDFLKITGYSQMLSGVVKTYHRDHKKRMEKEVAEREQQKTVVKVPAKLISDIVPAGTVIDYCTIDTEGSELQVLKSIDLEKTPIRCFTIEDHFGDRGIKKIMKKHGYELIQTIDQDVVYFKHIPG